MPISSPGHIDLLKAYWLWTVLIMSVLSVPLNRFDEVQSVLESPLPDGHRPASLPVRNPTKSFWIDTPGANPLAKEGSSGDLTSDADVCIIGSGITGVSAAYHLAKAANASDDNSDLKIVILEARDFCSGATGRNGGHLTPVAFLDFTLAQAAHGTDEAIRSLALEQYTVAEIVKILEEKDVAEAVDLVAGGHTTMLFTDAELEQAKRDFEAAKNAGVDLSDVEWISREEMETRFGASFPGFHFLSYNLWPLKLVTQLYLKASKLTSLHLHTNTPVEKITSIPANGSRAFRQWSLHTGRGKVACSYVIHATNAYASHLLPHMSGPEGIVPTRGQIVAIRADAPSSKLSKASWDGNEGFEYWFPRPVSSVDETPLVILGGGREAGSKFEYYETDDSSVNEVVGQALRGFLPSVFPKLYTRGKDPEMEWTGIMGYTSMRDPFVGPVLRPGGDNDGFDGQYIAAGYTGHGMPRAFACAEAVSQMVMAKVMGNEWVRPTWLPERYLTWKRYITSK